MNNQRKSNYTTVAFIYENTNKKGGTFNTLKFTNEVLDAIAAGNSSAVSQALGGFLVVRKVQSLKTPSLKAVVAAAPPKDGASISRSRTGGGGQDKNANANTRSVTSDGSEVPF